MRIIPEEMTEREDKNENEVSGAKNANRKVSDPDQKSFENKSKVRTTM